LLPQPWGVNLAFGVSRANLELASEKSGVELLKMNKVPALLSAATLPSL